jgi:hypothetical protein
LTSKYNVVYPPKGRMMFDGGQNNKFERSIIAENETPACANVVFANGAVETRGGTTRLNTAAIGSFVGDGLYTRRDNGGGETMVAFAGGTMWQLAVTSFTAVASAQSVFTAGVRVGTTQYENHMFIGNGGITPYKYNGAHFTRHGVPAPTTTMTVASQAVGVLTGGYNYKVVFVNSAAAFGNVSPATATFTAAGATLRVTSIPVAPTSHGINARRLYRTAAGGLEYKLVTTINDNTTTTYDDNNADSTLTVVAPTDNGEPPKYNTICYHQNRLFCNDTANPNYIWYSELNEPYTFGVTNFRAIGDASRDLVKGLEVYNNGVLVTCENSAHLIYMPSTDPTDWVVIRLMTSFGSRSPYGMFLFENSVMIPAMQNGKFVGFAAIAGTSVDPGATLLTTSAAGSDLQSDRIEPDMFQVQEAYVGNISSMVFKNKAYITLTYADGSSTNNRVYVFDFSRSNLSKNKTQKAAWSPITGLNATQFTVYDGKLYYLESAATGFVNQLETTTPSDNGSAINSYFWTKEISGNPGDENFQKDFRFVKILVEKSGPYYMDLVYRVDSDAGEGAIRQIDLSSDADVWGSKPWGTMMWGAGADEEEVTVFLGQVTGKRIQFKFSNQNAAGQRFKALGANVGYNIKGKR